MECFRTIKHGSLEVRKLGSTLWTSLSRGERHGRVRNTAKPLPENKDVRDSGHRPGTNSPSHGFLLLLAGQEVIADSGRRRSTCSRLTLGFFRIGDRRLRTTVRGNPICEADRCLRFGSIGGGKRRWRCGGGVDGGEGGR